jgi:hypothetical protein
LAAFPLAEKPAEFPITEMKDLSPSERKIVWDI